MLQSLYTSAVRTAHLDPYRFRHRLLVAAAALVATAVVLPNSVSAIAATTEDEVPVAPAAQVFVANQLATMPLLEREEFTMDVRPPIMYPVGAGAPLGSPFGPRDAACGACSTMHQGVDWNPGRGTPIVAMADGVVSKTVTSGSSLGVYVVIDHVIDGQALSSVYGHMENGSLTLRVGDEVRVGDQVGAVGSTGVTTAPHLHFEIRIGGRAINPQPWLAGKGAQ